jgi:hypothetical protein
VRVSVKDIAMDLGHGPVKVEPEEARNSVVFIGVFSVFVTTVPVTSFVRYIFELGNLNGYHQPVLFIND